LQALLWVRLSLTPVLTYATLRTTFLTGNRLMNRNDTGIVLRDRDWQSLLYEYAE